MRARFHHWNQRRVLQAARERAREYLRAEQDFIWNGTNISRNLRAKPLSLFRDYNARTKIVYIETSPTSLLSQNNNRKDMAPCTVIKKLIRKLEPPQDWEAHIIVNKLRKLFSLFRGWFLIK